MKATATILSLLGFSANAIATCYGSGETWGNNAQALSAVSWACHQLVGSYGGSETRGICVDANSKRLEFQIWHITSGSRELGYDECYDGFQKEVNGCTNGGDSSYVNWRYKGDPNAGSC
ncbi:hypothetical protein B0H63DRAFT_523241 [Podospora didyma]|uniref:Cyanovirin-N domain-containing protein n=1 Tax=Podospora didyma TaxID=330526 RepID=A0AAE0NQM1_9PEZI|nr:hypothetical protein B0H63DRAFT_523241 [Podospora didyma]